MAAIYPIEEWVPPPLDRTKPFMMRRARSDITDLPPVQLAPWHCMDWDDENGWQSDPEHFEFYQSGEVFFHERQTLHTYGWTRVSFTL